MFTDNAPEDKYGPVVVRLRMAGARPPPMRMARVWNGGLDAYMSLDTTCRAGWMQALPAKNEGPGFSGPSDLPCAV